MESEAWGSIRLVELWAVKIHLCSAPSAGAIIGKGSQAQRFECVLGIQTQLFCLQGRPLHLATEPSA